MAGRMNPDTHSDQPLRSPVRDEGLRCLSCDYNLTGLPSGLCPECGRAFDVDELRRELTGGVPRPVPIWDEPQRFGRPEAFVRTALRVWLRPDRFASTFPRTCAAGTPLAFSLTCHALAYLTGFGLACLLASDALIGEARAFGEGMLMTVIAIAVAAESCELLVAAGPFALAGAGPHRRYQYLTVRRMLRFTTCHLIVTCVACGGLIASGYSSIPGAGDVFLCVLGASLVLWWIGLSVMLVTLGRRFGGVVIGILLIPVIGALAIFFGLAMAALMGFLYD